MFLNVVFSPTNQSTNDQIPSLRDDSVICSEMDSAMTINGEVSNTGVTTFVNEACDMTDIFSNYVPSSLTVPQADLQDIKSYFARPRLITRGTVAFSSRSSVYSSTWDINSFTTSFPQWNNRLSGVYGIRYKLNYRLQIAATPFNSGVLALSWQYGPTTNDGYNYLRYIASASCTNLPHVRLDVSQQTMVELSVPFLWYGEFYPVSGGTVDSGYGRVSVNQILSPAGVTGTTAPTYELYVYMTEIELFGADNNNSTTITLQSGGVVKSEAKASHLLSNGFTTAGKIAKFIGSNIPSLSGIAGPTAWAADTAAGIARYFGYSRPLLQDPPLKIFRTLYGGETNVDVPMTGFNVGLMQSNTLATIPEFAATDVDEMSFDYIKQQYSQVCVAFVTTGDSHGTVIYAAPASPSVMWFRTPAAVPYCNVNFPQSSANLVSQSGNSFLPSSLMHLASNFRLWRGGFKLRVTFGKTKFHAGRYMISFNPTMVNHSYPVNYATIEGPERASTFVQPYGYSMIMDLKDENVFDFVIPYLLEAPYITFGSSMGGISIVCIDPLLGPATVPVSVPVLIEVCGDTDFSVNDYAGPYFVPHPSGVIYTQSGVVVSATKETPSTTVGEKLMSVKQIIQAPWWRQISVGANGNVILTPPPWFTSTTANTLIGGNTSPPSATIALFGAGNPGFSWSRCFVYARGGSDVHVYPATASSGVVVVAEQMPHEYRTFTSKNTAYTSRPFTSTMPKVVTYGEHPTHLRFPYFSSYQRTPVTAYDSLGYLPFTAVSDAQSGPWRAHLDKILIGNNGTGTSKIWLSAAAADDASLGHYIGPVPMYIPNSTNVIPIDGDWLS